MCAIAGILGLAVNEKILQEMENTMKHRGPDGKGRYEGANCVLLHSRLAIIDPENGHQPMRLAVGQQLFVISYNGEIYNSREIRSELEAVGHHFLTDCDTEVVLRAYVQWGEACLSRLNGIFAFAVWESHNRRLFLARDRMGVKPLFYTLTKQGLIFASEMKTILTHPDVLAELDEDGIGQLLLLGPSRRPGSGVFRNINELCAGQCAYYCNHKLSIQTYWKLEDAEHTDTFQQTVEHVRYLVTDAIERQMVSHVPIGTFLSGGLDSSIISSVCANKMKAHGHRLKTFSVDYRNNDKYFTPGKFQPTADAEYINQMQDYIGSDHHDTKLSSEELFNALHHAMLARDLPGMADVDASLLLFCGKIRKEVKVALSGECADEIFGGYPWYRDPEIRAAEGFPWAQNTALRAGLLLPGIIKYDPFAYVNDHYKTTINSADIAPDTNPIDKRMKEMTVLNQQWFMQTLLDRKDRMSMYWGLEVRVPFCDYRIAEYLYRIPWEYKDWQGREKGLLRKAVEGLLPDSVLWRKKSPYPKTYDPLYLKLVSACFEQMLLDRHAPIWDIVDSNAVKRLLDSEPQSPWYGQLMRLPQTLAYLIQINEWLKCYSVSLI